MTTGPLVGMASKGLLQGNLVDADSLHMVGYKVELLDMSRCCQWDSPGLECTVAVVVASAVPPVRNQCDFRWTNVVGRPVVRMVAGAPAHLRDTVVQIRPCPSPSLSNGSHNCH